VAIDIHQVNAFTDVPFAGNPAAVCPLEKPEDAAWMQRVAAEMNLSESAFLHSEGAGFRLRWFTPGTEVDLCGHATLAAAHLLWEIGRIEEGREITFHTRSGTLTARRADGLMWLDFPAEPAREVAVPDGLEAALGLKPRGLRANRFDLLVEVDGEEALRAVAPDMAALARLPVRGVIVTCAGPGDGIDFLSRFFAPAAGIPEDPVTGSAHCCLGPFWGERLGRSELVGFQASARGGTVRVRNRGDRVDLGGNAVTVWRGRLMDAAGPPGGGEPGA
jgi:PhzF family phenazine biosynthesis protein